MAKIISSTINLGSLLNKGAMLAQNSHQYNNLTNHLNNPHIKTHQVYEIDKDLLSLSVCWKRHRDSKEPQRYIVGLLDKELFALVKEDDIIKANTMRNYYSKKLMMWALTADKPLTPFRKDLSTFISGDGKMFKEEMVPLVFRLPELYEYDLAIDVIISNAKELNANLQPNQFLFLDKVNRTIKKTKKVEYWFINHINTLCRLTLDNNNILIPVLDTTLANADHIFTCEGGMQKRMRDDLVYYEFLSLA